VTHVRVNAHRVTQLDDAKINKVHGKMSK
jgi:hypothetical protein